MRRWPDTLPPPSAPGYQLAPVDPAIRTDMEVGARRVRRVTVARADDLQMRWRMTDSQFAAFRAWYDDAAWSIAGDSDSLSAWTTAGSTTLVTDSVVGPDTALADRIVETTDTVAHYAQHALGDAVIAGSALLARATVKAAGRNKVKFTLLDRDGGAPYATADLTTGTIGTQSGLTSATIETRGDGWWRITLTAPAGTGASTAAMRLTLLDDTGANSYAGDGVSGIDVCEINARLATGYDLFVRTGADGTALGAAGGSGWFDIDVPQGGGLSTVQGRFKGPFNAVAGAGLNWDVTAQVEVRNA